MKKYAPGENGTEPEGESALDRGADAVFYGTLAFLAGVFLATSHGIFFWLGIAAAIAWFLHLASWKRFRGGATVFIAFLFFGIIYFHLYGAIATSGDRIEFGRTVAFSGVITSEPESGERSGRFFLSLDEPFSGDVLIIVPRINDYSYGNRIRAVGKISPPERNEFFERPVSFMPKAEIIERGAGSRIKAALLDFKHLLIGVMRRSLPPDHAALLSGLTFGARGDFSEQFKNDMARSGTTHLVALSGYNIAILVLAIGSALKRYVSRRMTFWITTTAILLFVIMTGAESSVVRAAIMGFLALFARESGRSYSVRSAIVLTAGAMVAANPSLLKFNIGFELSFISLLGIVYLGEPLRRAFGMDEKESSFLGWKEAAVTTISAQLAVLPILMQYFNQFSLTALPANVLILEAVPLTMFFGFLLAGLGALFHPLGFLVSRITLVFLGYEIGVIKFFSAISIPLSGFLSSALSITIYYALLIAFVIHHTRTRHAHHE